MGDAYEDRSGFEFKGKGSWIERFESEVCGGVGGVEMEG